jgi:hypothetical protein
MTKTSKVAAGRSSSYTLTRQGNEESLQMVLPNGRNVEVWSKEGADEFVDTVGTDFISMHLTATDNQERALAYSLMIAVAENASLEKIASGIPESELRIFIEHTRDTLDKLSIDRNWLRSGTVSECHVSLLQTVACFTNHPSFLKIFLSSKGMEAVAKFYASRKTNKTPNKIVAQLILSIIGHSLCAFEKEGASLEKGFSTIEKTGILGQFIRCAPVAPEASAEIVTLLQACLQLVKKKLKSGTPTGDILDAVIAGKDGPINGKAKSDLSRLQTLARLSNYDAKRTDHKICRHCEKIEKLDGIKLMKCQRCKVIYYCNKECQVADWKNHKKMCNQLGIANMSQSVQKTTETTMWAFVEVNYLKIVKEVYKKIQEYNVSKKEIFVEIDFYGDGPALRNELKVWLTSDFLKGSSVTDAPEWFRKDADKEAIARFLRETYELVSSNVLLAVYRSGNGMVAVQILRVANAGGYELLSDEAVESIGKEDYVRMVACLGQHTTDKYFKGEKSCLT